jgi:small GTP-binding protein
MHSPARTNSQKICLIGDFGVGKTSLIRQFVDRQFSDQYLSTVGVKISKKFVSIAEYPHNTQEKSQQLQLMVWDIEGSSRFKAISPSHLQGAKGAIIVADVSRESSMQNLKDHVLLFQSVNPKSSLIIALNKVDLIESHERENLLQSIPAKFADFNVSTQVTSAKTGEGVDEMFQKLVHQMLRL